MYKTKFIIFLTVVFLACLALSGCSTQLQKPFASEITARDLIDQAVMQLEQGYDEQAMATFEMAFEIYPLAEALDGMGCVYLYRGQIGNAEKFFNLALEENPEYGVAVGHLATIAELRGQHQLADNLYQTALLYEPEDVRIRTAYSAFLFDRFQAGDTGLIKARHETLRANSLTNSDLIRDNFKIIEGEYEY